MSTLEPHLGGCWLECDPYTFMPEVWQLLIARYDIKSVLDLGCGAGWSVEWFAAHGLTVTGVEGDPEAIAKSRAPNLVRQHDYWTGPFPNSPSCDLCWMAEFVEHVDVQYLPNVMHDACQCRMVALTHAIPGQDGWHHVNCQTDGYWVDQFAQRGFAYDGTTSMELRALYKEPAPWGRNTIMLFKKQ